MVTTAPSDGPDASSRPGPAWPAPAVAWAAGAGYAAVLWALSVLRYHLWLAHGNDLGLFEQGLWLLRVRGPLAVSSYTGRPILADAGSWVLWPLAWVYAAGGVAALLGVQAAAFASGGPLILGLGRAMGVPARPALLAAAIYCLYPTVVGAALYDFHPDALAIPAALGLVWAMQRRRPGGGALLALVLLAVKDTAGLALVGAGAALAFRRRWAWAAALAAGGAAATWLDVAVAIPRLGHGVMAQWPLVYGYLGPTPAAGVLRLLREPWLLIRWVPHPRSWEYLAWLLGPPAGLLLVGRGSAVRSVWWLPWAAVVEGNLLGNVPSLTSPFDEFGVIAVPFLFAAVLDGLRVRSEARPGRPATPAVLALAGVFFAVFAAQQVRSYWLHAPAHAGALAAAVRTIPAGAPVAAQDFVLPHVADRDSEWHLANVGGGQAFPAGTYVVLDAQDADPPDAAVLPALSAALRQPGAAAPGFDRQGVAVYRLLRPLGPLRGAG